MRVLVVDDTAAVRLLLRLNLELDGAQVVEATDGRTCLTLLHEAAAAGSAMPDVVTLDAVMEPVDGWTALRSIRSEPQLAWLPVVMVTASVQAHHRARARDADVDLFVTKPFDPAALCAAVLRLAADGRSR